MTAVMRRIAKLESQLGTSEGTPRILYLVCKAGTTQADMDSDIQIPRESGFCRRAASDSLTSAGSRVA